MIVEGNIVGTPEYYGSRTKQTALQIHYTQSIYYVFWWVIADRMSEGGCRIALEFGCGSGQLAELLFDKGLMQYHGFDISDECIKMCNERKNYYTRWNDQIHEEHLGRFRFRVDDVMTSRLMQIIPYDVCISTEVLEHLEDDLAAVDRIKSGARCFMSVPNCPSPTHVRIFYSVRHVMEHYQGKFKDVRVDPFLIHGSDGQRKTIFLLDGIKT